MKETDNQQRTLLNLVLEGIEVVRWNVMGKNTGIVIRNDSQKIKYALDVKHWNAHLPPSFNYKSKGLSPSPEYKVRKLIREYFISIKNMLTKNEWIKCDDVINLNEKESIALFNLSGIGSHYVIVDLPLQADPYISCHQLIDAAERNVLKRFKSMVEAETISNIGKKNTHKLFNADPEKRTMMYLKMYQQCQTA